MLLGKKKLEVLQENSTVLAKKMQKNFQDIVDRQNNYFNEKLQELERINRKHIKEEINDQIRVLKQNGEI